MRKTAVRQGVLITLAALLAAITLEVWADRGALRGHSRFERSVRPPSAIVRLPSHPPKSGRSSFIVTLPERSPKHQPRKFFHRHRSRPPHRYYAPAYVAPSVAYRSSDAAGPQGSAYFCTGSRRYYPDVRECPSGWLTVIPEAPGPTDGLRR